MSCLHQHTGDKHNMSGDAIQLNEHMTERKEPSEYSSISVKHKPQTTLKLTCTNMVLLDNHLLCLSLLVQYYYSITLMLHLQSGAMEVHSLRQEMSELKDVHKRLYSFVVDELLEQHN